MKELENHDRGQTIRVKWDITSLVQNIAFVLKHFSYKLFGENNANY